MVGIPPIRTVSGPFNQNSTLQYEFSWTVNTGSPTTGMRLPATSNKLQLPTFLSTAQRDDDDNLEPLPPPNSPSGQCNASMIEQTGRD